jgi:hypothetical protein
MQAELALSILGSSIALLSGQKPSFRLLVRAVQTSTGQRAKHLGQAVSDAFVVRLFFPLRKADGVLSVILPSQSFSVGY